MLCDVQTVYLVRSDFPGWEQQLARLKCALSKLRIPSHSISLASTQSNWFQFWLGGNEMEIPKEFPSSKQLISVEISLFFPFYLSFTLAFMLLFLIFYEMWVRFPDWTRRIILFLLNFLSILLYTTDCFT